MMRRAVLLVGLLLVLVVTGGVLIREIDVPSEDDAEGNLGSPDQDNIIRVGVMSSTDRDLDSTEFLGESALGEINNFCEDSGVEYRFEFLYGSVGERAPNAKNLTIQWHEEGAEVIVGYLLNNLM
jgi:hypothetical protein